MITDFEEITKELSEDEKQFLQPLINGFLQHTKDNPIKTPQIVSGMNNWASEKGINVKFNGVRLRKMVNHIRSTGMLPIIATSEGYYCSSNQEDIKKQIQSLRERAASINRCADGLMAFVDEK